MIIKIILMFILNTAENESRKDGCGGGYPPKYAKIES
jgi:hypothetical protein